MASRIRPIAIGVFLRDDALLVLEGTDSHTGSVFHRPLGGGIEFGERGAEALVREMREEIDAEITNVRPLGVIESLFTFEGRPGHELVFVYAADFVDPSFDARRVMVATEGHMQVPVVWKRLGDFGPERPLYPVGLMELVHEHRRR